jgi:hypothetical protein
MKAASRVFLAFGALMLAVACINASEAPNVSYMVGSFLPGMVCLIVGLKLGQRARGARSAGEGDGAAEAAPDPARGSLRGDRTPIEALKSSADRGINGGILLMFLGSAVARGTEDGFPVGLLVSFCGFAWVIWGCVNSMRWKGYSGWFGLFGYLLLPGWFILSRFPNRRRPALQGHGPEPIGQVEVLSEEDRSPGYRYLLALAPLVVLGIGLAGFMVRVQSNIDAAEWKDVAPDGLGFRALMPGTPRLEEDLRETPVGRVELHKITVEPKGKRELFMIVSIRVPEVIGRELGGAEKLLEIGRADLLAASGGQVKDQRRFVSNGCPGLELDVLPPKGAMIKARLYARGDQIFSASVHVPKVRLASRDVRKFFDSFHVSAESGTEADPALGDTPAL